MSTVFIFHGYGGYPEKNWFPWLKIQLEQDGHSVCVPAMPDPEHPDLKRWFADFPVSHLADPECMIIGHSLGATFALRLLERLDHPIAATFLVAPVPGPLGNDLDPILATFIDHPFAWNVIRRNCPRFTVFHAKNDPYIRLPLAQDLARNLGTTLTLIPGGGHLNATAGFTEFPLLLEHVRSSINI
ncbi:MAG: alpha/beta fold hydrolase [Patescibacteria group bacterium]